MNHFAGKTLRERREALGLSLHDMHLRTHVPVVYLDAFERNDLERLPVPGYAVGFLQSYCLALELDAEPFIDRYRLCQHDAGQAMDGGIRRRMAEVFYEPKKRPAWLEEALAWGAICLILLLGWVTYAAATRPMAEKAGARVDAGRKEMPAPRFDIEQNNQ